MLAAGRSILLVDNDTNSLGVTELSLRKAGFAVRTAATAPEAIAALGEVPADLVISEIKLDGMDGFELCRMLKEQPSTRDVPVLFLTNERSIDSKIAGLELGIADYLTKPMYMKELVTRIRIVLERREKERLHGNDAKALSGQLADMSVLDVTQTMHIGKKSGVVNLDDAAGAKGQLVFSEGTLVDARSPGARGTEAVYRLFRWDHGRFEVTFAPTPVSARVVEAPFDALVAEALRRATAWEETAAKLPGGGNHLTVDIHALRTELSELPDEMNVVLRNLDGTKTLAQLIDTCGASGLGSLESLTMLTRLCTSGIAVPHAGTQIESEFTDAETGRFGPTVEDSTAVELPSAQGLSPASDAQHPGRQFGQSREAPWAAAARATVPEPVIELSTPVIAPSTNDPTPAPVPAATPTAPAASPGIRPRLVVPAPTVPVAPTTLKPVLVIPNPAGGLPLGVPIPRARAVAPTPKVEEVFVMERKKNPDAQSQSSQGSTPEPESSAAAPPDGATEPQASPSEDHVWQDEFDNFTDNFGKKRSATWTYAGVVVAAVGLAVLVYFLSR